MRVKYVLPVLVIAVLFLAVPVLAQQSAQDVE